MSLNVNVNEGSQTSVTVGVVNEGAVGHSIVLGAGKDESNGVEVFKTVMLCVAVLVLPQWSIAVQVRVTANPAGQELVAVASVNVSVGEASHASVAVGVAKTGLAGQAIVDGAGNDEITGAVVSRTVMT